MAKKLLSPFRKSRGKIKDFLKRRPHRSFKKTSRREARVNLKLPGYTAFLFSVWKTIWQNKKFYLKFFLLFCGFAVVLLGVLNQESYTNFRDQLNQAEGSGSTNFGALKYVTLAVSAITSNTGLSISDGQKVVGVLMFIIGWLMIVWALRQILVGRKVRLRDALYSSGSSLVSTLAVLAVAVLQLIPLALCFVIYNALTGVGIINSGIAIENMAFWFAAALVATLTLYWWTSTFMALIIVTLPGMYPGKALRMAGDMVAGRRLQILFRLLHMAWPMLLVWVAVLVPATILDNVIQINWLPLVPFTVLLMMGLTIVWATTYVYLLYREVVENVK
ncbi:hypothetical protein FWF93_01760 [Candidatus Saccharibacteria bacterium]|nr:hypothetical protein [Candidatus Saccharibacteria bacterium]